MSEDAPPRPRGAATVAAAAARGFTAFLVVALAGQLIGFAEWFALHRPFGVRFPLKVGWLYLLAFHRVGIDVHGPGLSFFGEPAPAISFRVHLALLTGTALAAIALYRCAGRGRGEDATTRSVAALAMVTAYATPIFVGSLAVQLRFPSLGAEIRPVVWESLAMPALVAAVALLARSLAGRAGTRRSRRMIAASVRGGGVMFVDVLVLAAVGLVLLAGIRPDGAAAYWRAVTDGGPVRTAVVLGHQALLLPNQSIFVVTPAMGSCDVAASSSHRQELLCLGREPVAGSLGGVFHGAANAGTSMPTVFLLFLLVPAIATVLGGRSAGRGMVAGERWVAGAGSGVVFAMLMWIGAAAATIVITSPPSGGPLAAGSVRIGPDLPATAMLALAWGVVGGAIGALVFAGRQPDDQAGGAPAA